MIDDDQSQAALIAEVVSGRGHSLRSFMNGENALNALRQERFDMLILNWQTLGQCATSVLHHVRSEMPSDFPVLFITPPNTETEIVAAFAAGATDYIVKPLRRRELATRIAALLQRAYPERHAQEQLHFGRYIFDPRSGKLDIGDQQVILTQKEFSLALLFFRNLGKPLSRVYIQESVWPNDEETPSRTLDTHVSRVRTKLRLQPENGFRLTPVYSFGYKLEPLDQ
ncbi:MAG TPA: response regulator transcription factor [Noviherbaspirillum sp.]|uniref:response regulator transcription factor n=1 Tax=Noviherbaspirillum sp. TaxID=1926288 RepID=UPI002DDCA05F|nr:response regulator transcription factor [Noviherbaspirillum sp.]HEV2612384.1 response regulator transcription factor [Noviherbaspirillum sp.]